MKVKNNGPDIAIFGLHFAEGRVVDVPDTLQADKVAYLARQFQVVADESVELHMDDPLPPPEVEVFDAIEAEPAPSSFLRGRKRRGKA